jgi:acyl-CoA thioesterase-1
MRPFSSAAGAAIVSGMKARLTAALAVVLVALVVAVLPLLAADEATQPAVRKIACVGDSITFGSTLKDREHDSYPAQLQQMLGDQWNVMNFGYSGATLLKKGNRPYWDGRRFAAALDFAPDVVVIKLGTNDSKPDNWKHKDEFHDDLTAMIKRFRGLPSRPTVWLCHPVPAFPGNYGIRDEVIRDEIIPIIDAVAKEQEVKVIDLYAALAGKAELFPDTIHPNTEGAGLIAAEVYKSLTGKSPSPATRASTAPATK